MPRNQNAPVPDAFQKGVARVDEAAAAGALTVSTVAKAGAGNLAVSFADIDRMSAAVRSHTEFARDRVAVVARMAADADLVCSMPLSPLTGAASEAAITHAAGRLVAHVVAAEALAIISATVVSTYQLADSALASGAAQLSAAGGLVGAYAVSVGEVGGSAFLAVNGGIILLRSAVVLVTAVELAAVMGVLDEFAESFIEGLRQTIDAYVEDPALIAAGLPLFLTIQGMNTSASYSPDDAVAASVSRLQSFIGATGPLYDDILTLLVGAGNTLGWFVDGDAVLVQPPIDEQEIGDRLNASSKNSWESIMESSGSFRTDTDGHVLPSDLTSLFASGQQIDLLGRGDFAVIRVISNTDETGQIVGYIVQIPSTQSSLPWHVDLPNDLTADLHSMRGGQTALARSVLEAMTAAGIRQGSNQPPIMVTGFSLGGITAAALGSDNHGFNIKEVVTAGAPIARMNIPGTVGVTAFEFTQDVIPALDGADNPDAWTTVRGPGLPLATEIPPPAMAPTNVHNLNRYAVMANNEHSINNDPKFKKFLGGDVEVMDFYATNR